MTKITKYFCTLTVIVLAAQTPLMESAFAAKTIRMGPNASSAGGAFTYSSLKAYMNESIASRKCLSGGDRVELERGILHVGRLRFQECATSTNGTVTITGYTHVATGGPWISNYEKFVGLQWEHVPTPTYKGQVVSHLVGKPIYRIGPINSEVVKLDYDWKKLNLAREPSLSLSRGYTENHYHRMSNLWQYSPTGCQAGYCITTESATASDMAIFNSYGHQGEASAIVRNSMWSLKKSPVTWTSSSNGSFAIAHVSGGVIDPKEDLAQDYTGYSVLATPGYGYAVVNTLPLMDTPGEWYWDNQTKYLYLHYDPGTSIFPESVPSKSKTRIFVRGLNDPHYDAVISVLGTDKYTTKIDNLTIDGVKVWGSAGAGIVVSKVGNVNFNNVGVSRSRKDGFAVTDILGSAVFHGAYVYESGNNGMNVRTVEKIEIYNSTILLSGIHGNPDNVDMNMNGVRASGYGRFWFVGNTVEESGYSSIMLTEPQVTSVNPSLIVRDNTLKNYNRVVADGAGFYIHGGVPSASSQYDDQFITSKWIYDNEITSWYGNAQGWVPSSPSSPYQTPIIVGVYFDFYSRFNAVYNNTYSGPTTYNWYIRKVNLSENNVFSNTINGVFEP